MFDDYRIDKLGSTWTAVQWDFKSQLQIKYTPPNHASLSCQLFPTMLGLEFSPRPQPHKRYVSRVLGSYVFLKPFEAESVYPSRKGCNVVAFFFQDYIQVGESHFMQLYCHLCWNMIWNSPSNHAYAYVSCKVKVSLLVELFWKILFKFLTGFKFTHHFRDSVVWWFFSFWSTFPTPPPPHPPQEKKKKLPSFSKKKTAEHPGHGSSSTKDLSPAEVTFDGSSSTVSWHGDFLPMGCRM